MKTAAQSIVAVARFEPFTNNFAAVLTENPNTRVAAKSKAKHYTPSGRSCTSISMPVRVPSPAVLSTHIR